MEAIAAKLGFQTTGYKTRSIANDITLGLISGIDYVLWCYAFASMVFIGSLSSNLPLGVLSILIANGFFVLWVALTSRLNVHLAIIGEQGVAIIATIAIIMNTQISNFTGPLDHILTMYAIMALVCILFSISFFAIAHYKLDQLIQLIPYPVICGFLAGIGWLLFDVAFIILTDNGLSLAFFQTAFSADGLLAWMPALIGGGILVTWMHFNRRSYVMPLCLMAFFLGFYAFTSINDISTAELKANGWLFDIDAATPLIDWQAFGASSVNLPFILSVIPEILTLLFICLLSAFFNFSALETVERKPIDLKKELKSQAVANIGLGLLGGMPGFTDIAGTTIYKRVGGSSRWIGIITGVVCIVVAIAGAGFIAILPKLVIGALIFLFAFHFFNDWLIQTYSRVNRADYLAIWAIFITIVFIGFIPGIIIGIAISSLLFIVRYARINIVSSAYSLKEHNSSVDRSVDEQKILQKKGRDVFIYNFRGFLFFGSANRFYDSLKNQCQGNPSLKALIFNFNNVSGMDSTAGQVFFKLVQYLDSLGIKAIFCGLSGDTETALSKANVLNDEYCLTFPHVNASMAYGEDLLLSGISAKPALKIEDIFLSITDSKAKSESLAKICSRTEYGENDYLFRQGDSGSNIFIIQQGRVSIELETPSGAPLQIREFRAGTVIGEMSCYTHDQIRSASARALENCVVYQINPENLNEKLGDTAIFHEFTARLLVTRINFMNKRLMIEN